MPCRPETPSESRKMKIISVHLKQLMDQSKMFVCSNTVLKCILVAAMA